MRNYDGILQNCEPQTSSTHYRMGFEDGKAGREYSCRAGNTNAYARLDYSAGYEAGKAAA